VPGTPPRTFLDRPPATAFRLVCYNVKWNSIFPEVDARRAARFARVVQALNPDILALQEIGMHPQDRGQPGSRKWKADDVIKLMNFALPLTDGAWQAYQGKDSVIVSRCPLRMTAAKLDPPGERELALALVDLPDDRCAADVYVLNNHFKCCDAEKNDPLRQRQADALVSWLRDARTPGGEIDLPTGTGLLIVGDLNIVGSFAPVQTLLDGDIHDETQYGPDAPPDWDNTPLADARPRHNLTGDGDWTWRDDTSQYKPGRLDYIIYSDSVLTASQTFALDTTTMSEAELAAAGLERLDVCHDQDGQVFDHLPLVADFVFGAAPSSAPATQESEREAQASAHVRPSGARRRFAF
jgi:endonuclease/exonuclease/phosphatase family metal-dependent hydrolase